MPFEKLSEVEFNFIWVGGGNMPDDQADNLINFVLQSHLEHTSIMVWVDNEATYKVIAAQLQAQIKRKNKEIDEYNIINKRSIPHISFKEQLKNLKFKIISPAELGIPQMLNEFIEKTRAAKLWAGLSDIYRLLILSRKHKENEPHARFYVEADNRMMPELWSSFKYKEVAATGYKKFGNSTVFAPTGFRTDLLLLDITSEQGISFAANIRNNLLKLVAEDPVLKIYFELLLVNAIKNHGLAEEDVLGSYGMIITALFRMQFMQPNEDTIYGFKDIIVAIESISKLFGPLSKIITEDHSWLDPNKQLAPLEAGMLYKLIMFRIGELSDLPDGVVTQKNLEEIGADSKEHLLNATAGKLYEAYREIPQWFLDASRAEDEIAELQLKTLRLKNRS